MANKFDESEESDHAIYMPIQLLSVIRHECLGHYILPTAFGNAFYLSHLIT